MAGRERYRYARHALPLTTPSPQRQEAQAMMAGPAAALAAALAEGRFSGRSEFAALVRQALAAAAAQGWREMVWSDPDFADWPLGERAVAQALGDWSASGRKLTLLAASYDPLARQHARFVTWRRTWSHIVDCRRPAATSPASADTLPSALWSPGWVFERQDKARSAGMAGAEPVRRTALKMRLDEWLLNSSPAFPATVLGL